MLNIGQKNRMFQNKDLSGFTAKILFFAFLYLILPNTLSSQVYPVDMFKDTLKNGLKIIYHVDKSAPVVTVAMHYNVGSLDEEDGKTGYTHLMEHLMMYEGTKNIPKGMAEKYIEEAGGTRNAYTYFNETVFYQKVPSHEVKLAIWLEADRMRNLIITKEGINTQRNIILEEIKSEQENLPYGSHFRKFTEIIFDAWPISGYKEDLLKADTSSLEKFYYTYYQPNNATLVISGDYRLYTIKEEVEKQFAAYEKYEGILREYYELPKIKENYTDVIKDEKAKLPAVFMFLRGPVAGTKDFYSMSIIAEILTGGYKSRLEKKLVKEEELSLNVDMDLYCLKDYGGILIQSIANPGKEVEDIIDVINDELEEMADDEVSDRELQKAKNSIEAKLVYRRTDVTKKAMTLARYSGYYNYPELINLELQNYFEVTKQDIIKAAKKYLITDRKAILIYKPE